MADEKDKEKKQELAKAEEQPKTGGLTIAEVMAHPVVQEMNRKLEDMGNLLRNLPEAIGRAVAEAQRTNSNRVPLVSGPAIELRPGGNGSVEFHRKGRIVEDGKEIVPEGMKAEPGSLDRDLDDIRKRVPPRKLKQQ